MAKREALPFKLRTTEAVLIDPNGNIIDLDQDTYANHYEYLMDEGVITGLEEPPYEEDWSDYEEAANNQLYDKGYVRVREYLPGKLTIASGGNRAYLHPNLIADLMDKFNAKEVTYERNNTHEFAGDWLDYMEHYNRNKTFENASNRLAQLLKEFKY